MRVSSGKHLIRCGKEGPHAWLDHMTDIPTLPYANFRFKIKMDGVYVAGMSGVSGLSRPTQVSPRRGDPDPSVPKELSGQTEYAALRFERGTSDDSGFEAWANGAFEHQISGSQDAGDFRKDLTLDVFNEAGQLVLSYVVHQAWVSDFQATSDLDADGVDRLIIQSMTVQNEGWERDVSA